MLWDDSPRTLIRCRDRETGRWLVLVLVARRPAKRVVLAAAELSVRQLEWHHPRISRRVSGRAPAMREHFSGLTRQCSGARRTVPGRSGATDQDYSDSR